MAFLLLAQLIAAADDHIPAIAWHIPIGQPPANPGGRKPELTGMIDDGFWQGAPVGGFGAGTFSRSYRGNFERWHIKAGVHKYQNVPANQFAVFAQAEGEPAAALAMEHLRHKNGGFPDQTYDEWVARGESAYSGGLYLAALRATAEMAGALGDNTSAANYDAQFKKAQAAYVKNL